MYRVAVVLLLLHQMSLVCCWMMSPYGNRDFNYRQEYGSNATLMCQDNRIPDSPTFKYWIRPDLTIMKNGASESFWTLDGYATWRVSSDGMELHATLLNEKHFGFYYCVVSAGGKEFVVKKAINYDGPYFGNLWPKYRMNVIIGLSAAGVFIVLCVFLALLIKFCDCGGEPEGDAEGDEKMTGTANGEMTSVSKDDDNSVRQRYNAHTNLGAQYEEVRL